MWPWEKGWRELWWIGFRCYWRHHLKEDNNGPSIGHRDDRSIITHTLFVCPSSYSSRLGGCCCRSQRQMMRSWTFVSPWFPRRRRRWRPNKSLKTKKILEICSVIVCLMKDCDHLFSLDPSLSLNEFNLWSLFPCVCCWCVNTPTGGSFSLWFIQKGCRQCKYDGKSIKRIRSSRIQVSRTKLHAIKPATTTTNVKLLTMSGAGYVSSPCFCEGDGTI